MTDIVELENAAVEMLLKSSLMMLISASEKEEGSSSAEEACAPKSSRLPIPRRNASQKPKKRLWVEKWRERKQLLASLQLLPHNSRLPPQSCKNYIGMDEQNFKEILGYIADDIRRQGTVMRTAVPPEQKLSATLRFLATGESINALNLETGYSNKFLSESVMEVCDAICHRMNDNYMQFPVTKEDWLQTANKFTSRWEFPHCLGALDCKHIQFIAPKRERDSLFVERSFNSVTLLALVDSDFKFIYVDIGRHGPIKDEEVLYRSPLIHTIRRGKKHLPSDDQLGQNRLLPYVVIADDAFPLERHLMKPYSNNLENPQRKIFNARLSHARQCAERTLGILCNTFRVLQTKIYLNHDKVKRLILCCCILHNFLMETNTWYREQILSQDEKDAMLLLEVTLRKDPPEATIFTEVGESIRESFAEFFSNEGSTPWQQNYVELEEVTKLV